MAQIYHQAETRGLADHGWLLSRHTFSFADYHNPERISFGLLRVLNDDIVEPAMGFGTHPHENMEIVSIPLTGSLRHRDSMGNEQVISSGEVQVMSAGSGITHSEYNNSTAEEVNFLQIWVFPQQRDIEPRYEQRYFDAAGRQNRFQTIVAPEKDSEALWINQQAWFSLARLDAGQALEYRKHQSTNGVYCFVLEGRLTIDGLELARRDGLGLTGSEKADLKAINTTELLCIEVPMT